MILIMQFSKTLNSTNALNKREREPRVPDETAAQPTCVGLLTHRHGEIIPLCGFKLPNLW